MKTEVWVTYMTSHPSGHYYIGKSSLRRINAGYQGSGPKLKCVFLHPGFEPWHWATRVTSTHPTEVAAYLEEERRVPLSLLSDPYCLNTQPGGNKRFYGSPYAKILAGIKTRSSVPAVVTKLLKKLPKGL